MKGLSLSLPFEGLFARQLPPNKAHPNVLCCVFLCTLFPISEYELGFYYAAMTNTDLENAINIAFLLADS